MKPLRISGFLISLLLVILLIPFLFPGSKLSLFGYSIRIPDKIKFHASAQNQYKDISQITYLLEDSTLEEHPTDTVSKKITRDTVQKHDSISITKKKENTKNIQPLEFPPGNDTLLDPFFKTLSTIDKQSDLIRILHYGDSQIEADRITSYFRSQMQKQFGGSGIGMIPVVPINPASISYAYDVSSNWKRFSILNTHRTPNDPEYGILGCFSRFNLPDEILSKETEAWIFLKNANTSYPNASKFNHCKLMLAGNRTPIYIELKKNEGIIDADIYPAGKDLRVIDWKVDTGARNLQITIKGKDSPDLYAISLDSDRGVVVDNIPLRGSSGLELSRLYQAPYDKMLTTLNVKMIMLQFGVNAVSNMSKNIAAYEKAFLKQLMVLRNSHPEIPIIVIGVSDISENTTEGYTTNEAVEKIRDAQKRASFAAGCVFWDMYEGMGGKNSMPSWVFAKPSLAQKDFIHLNPLGAKIIGEMFYRSIINEYSKFIKRNIL